MSRPRLTLRSIRTRAVRVPMRRPLGTSVARMTEAPFLLVDIETAEGVAGRAHAFCYMALAAPAMRHVLAEAETMTVGAAVEPEQIAATLRARFALVGAQGIVGMALAALDVACWDALARADGVPLARLLDARRDAVPAYNSNGLSLTEPDALGEEALALLGGGFKAVKIRLGRADPEADAAAVRAVRQAVPADTMLMADYNQALTPEDAIGRGQALATEGLHWIEEPVAHDDLVGSARVAAALATPVQIGENFSGPHVLESAVALRAADLVMPDLMRIGGVTGWMRAAEIAALAGLPMSSHLYPEISVHLLAATATADWLEYIDWAEPLLAEPLPIRDGWAHVPDRSGTGVEWDEKAVARFLSD